jgi:hypothetical protein
MEGKQQCPEFPHFGAKYPDAACIDGYLWDLDSYEAGHLMIGGDHPCPFCNSEEYIEMYLDEDEGLTRDVLLKQIENTHTKYS